MKLKKERPAFMLFLFTVIKTTKNFLLMNNNSDLNKDV
jgi:hypothetical protein